MSVDMKKGSGAILVMLVLRVLPLGRGVSA
jgi:hypothetical protein